MIRGLSCAGWPDRVTPTGSARSSRCVRQARGEHGDAGRPSSDQVACRAQRRDCAAYGPPAEGGAGGRNPRRRRSPRAFRRFRHCRRRRIAETLFDASAIAGAAPAAAPVQSSVAAGERASAEAALHGRPRRQPRGAVRQHRARDTCLWFMPITTRLRGCCSSFVRRGDERGELRLPSMRRGQPVAVAIPAEVCAGVERTRLEVRASAAPGAPEASFGPYDLSC